jgi:hypothetical protein
MASGLNFGFKRSFKQSVQWLKKLTGKKSIIIAHSFGTVNTYSAILDLTPEEKKEYIEFWAPVGGPLMGNQELMSTMVTGENPLSFLNGIIGLAKQQALKSFYEVTFAFELLPFNFWKFEKENWFKNFVLKRTMAEIRSDPVEVARPMFFPNPSNECYKSLQNSPVSCKFLKSIYPGKSLLALKDKKYPLSDMKDFLDDLDYSYPDNKNLSLYDVYSITEGNYREYPHPGVPVVGFFFNIKPTQSEIYFKEEKFDFEAHVEDPRKVFMTGDVTVETYSAIMPMLKWAYEYSYSEDTGEYPVKFIDLCSGINRQVHPYDSDEYDDKFKFNSYIGKLWVYISYYMLFL